MFKINAMCKWLFLASLLFHLVSSGFSRRFIDRYQVKLEVGNLFPAILDSLSVSLLCLPDSESVLSQAGNTNNGVELIEYG